MVRCGSCSGRKFCKVRRAGIVGFHDFVSKPNLSFLSQGSLLFGAGIHCNTWFREALMQKHA